MNVFLIGFMGSGKTHWGKLWAADSGMSFYDLDNMIEEAVGKSVAEIFEEYDEDFTSRLRIFNTVPKGIEHSFRSVHIFTLLPDLRLFQ